MEYLNPYTFLEQLDKQVYLKKTGNTSVEQKKKIVLSQFNLNNSIVLKIGDMEYSKDGIIKIFDKLESHAVFFLQLKEMKYLEQFLNKNALKEEYIEYARLQHSKKLTQFLLPYLASSAIYFLKQHANQNKPKELIKVYNSRILTITELKPIKLETAMKIQTNILAYTLEFESKMRDNPQFGISNTLKYADLNWVKFYNLLHANNEEFNLKFAKSIYNIGCFFYNSNQIQQSIVCFNALCGIKSTEEINVLGIKCLNMAINKGGLSDYKMKGYLFTFIVTIAIFLAIIIIVSILK